MFGTPQTLEFWKMLSSYEDATIQEARAIAAQDFVRLDVLGDYKRTTLQKMRQLGVRLGLDRSNGVLRERLEALQQAELLNIDAAAGMMAQMRKETDGVLSAQRRLNSLRGAYAGDTPMHGFFAEG